MGGVKWWWGSKNNAEKVSTQIFRYGKRVFGAGSSISINSIIKRTGKITVKPLNNNVDELVVACRPPHGFILHGQQTLKPFQQTIDQGVSANSGRLEGHQICKYWALPSTLVV